MIELTDVVIAVYTDPEKRTRRVMLRDGIDENKWAVGLKLQKEWEEMKQVADYVVDNSISLEFTKSQLKQILLAWRRKKQNEKVANRNCTHDAINICLGRVWARNKARTRQNF